MSEKLDITKCNEWFKLAEDAQNPWKKQAQEDLRFTLGSQWKADDLAVLREQKRPALTFNHILPYINLVSGYQRQNRQDIKVHNKQGGTKEVADIFTAIIKDIGDNSNGDFEVSMAFLLGLITGKGWLGANVSYDNDPYNGELLLESYSPFLVYPDPYHERYDLSDAMYVFKVAWLSKDRIELIYPEKKKELVDGFTTEPDDRMLYSESSSSSKEDTYATGEGSSGGMGISEISKYKFRVKECWYREYEVETFLYDLQSGKAKLTDLPAEKINNILKRAKNWRKIKRVTPHIKLKTYVGNTELEDMEPYVGKLQKKGLTRLPLVPFYTCWIEQRHLSLVTPLKDPQMEINKRYSQLLHHLNMSANSGWLGDTDAVTDWDALEQMGSRPGVTIKKKKGAHLERITPAQLSEGHLMMSREGSNQIKQVSGVDPGLFGMTPERGKESGIALQVRQRQGITVLEPALDNFRATKQALGRVLIELIQKSGTYSREEILRLVVDGEEKEFPINQKQKKWFGAVTRIQNDLAIGRYGCTVAQQPANPTVRLANFYSLLEAVKVGLPIPPTAVIKASDIPEKEKILEGIDAQQKAQAQGAQLEMEIKKGELRLNQEELKLKQDELKLKVKEVEIKGQIELAKAENKGGSK